MNAFRAFITKSMPIFLVFCFCIGITGNLTAEAKKKAAGPDPAAQADAEVKKGVDPLNEQLTKLMIKVQSRALLSPEDAGKLADIKYKLQDLMDQYPQSVLLSKPIYQAGILFSEREEYNDAYELFNFLAQSFPTNPYGTKAKSQIQQLEKRFGPAYFSAEPSATGNVAPNNNSTTVAAPAAKK
jgi:hypothetical protein